MGELSTLGIEPELIPLLHDISRRTGTTMTVLINMALREFIFSLDDDFEAFLSTEL